MPAIAVVLSAAVAWTPWAVVWADQISNAAAAGQAAGAAARGALALPSQDGNAIVMPGGTGGNLSFTTLFPGSAGGDPATFSQWYGDGNAVAGSGREAQANLMTEQSTTGAAYRTVRGAVDRSRPDMRNDPLWSQTDHVLDNFDDLASTFADCSTVTTFQNSTRKTHVEDLRTCEVVAKGGNCSWYHDYSLPPANTFVTASGGAVVNNCGVGCDQMVYNHGNVLAQFGKTFPPVHPGQTFGFGVADSTRVTKVYVTISSGDPAIVFERTRPDWGLRADHWHYQYSAQFPGYSYSTTGADMGNIYRTALWNADYTTDLKNGGSFTIANTLQARNDGSNIWYTGSWNYNVTVTVYYTPTNRPVYDWGWTTNEACRGLHDQVIAGGCGGSVQCIGAPALAANGCYQDTGVQVCPGDLAQPPVAVSPFCREVRVTSDCSTINVGPMDCWTDAQGQVQCPINAGGHDNCKELEDDPNCGFVRERCVEGATRNGVCFVKEQIWDCGTLHSIPVLKREQSVDCAGPVRCMGTDCASSPGEQSADFARAAAALQAAQMMVTDMQCSPGGACVVFGGEAHECKRAVGGIVDCCKTPEGVSLGNYLSLIFSISKIDSAILATSKGNAMRGAWETLRQPVTSTWSAVQDSFTSVANTFTGRTAEAATDVAAQGVLETAKQELLQATAEWAAQTFGDGAVNVLFSAVEGGAAVTNGGVNGALQLGGGGAWLGTMMVWAMYAYTLYMVAMILIKLIWTCEQEEFELGAKRELKACHNVGGYCKQKLLGWCIEKRDAYCCFNTPLSRILNEQIRPQLGRGWGSAKNPDCRGIDVQDFARVDWNQVHLDEWLAILFATGHFPSAETLDIEGLTGSGSLLSGGAARPDAAGRTLERTTGTDAEQRRIDAEDELWSDALPNLPTEPQGVP